MALTVPDAIAAESFFKVTVGTGGKITNEQLTILQTAVADDVNNFIGNRTVSADTKTRIIACFILDIYANKGGNGTVVQEAVTDASTKYQIKTTSQYMDRAYSILTNVDSKPDEYDLSGVTREDASIAIERDNELTKIIFGDW